MMVPGVGCWRDAEGIKWTVLLDDGWAIEV